MACLLCELIYELCVGMDKDIYIKSLEYMNYINNNNLTSMWCDMIYIYIICIYIVRMLYCIELNGWMRCEVNFNIEWELCCLIWIEQLCDEKWNDIYNYWECGNIRILRIMCHEYLRQVVWYDLKQYIYIAKMLNCD